MAVCFSRRETGFSPKKRVAFRRKPPEDGLSAARKADGSTSRRSTADNRLFSSLPAAQARVADGILADVAPSLLHILGLPQPAEMTGRNLIAD